MVDLLYVDTVQQLEVVLLRTFPAQVIDILASRLTLSPQLDTPSQPHPKMYRTPDPGRGISRISEQIWGGKD